MDTGKPLLPIFHEETLGLRETEVLANGASYQSIRVWWVGVGWGKVGGVVCGGATVSRNKTVEQPNCERYDGERHAERW